MIKNNPKVFTFIIPQTTERSDKNYPQYLVSVDEIEQKTGLDFLTILPDEAEEEVEKSKASMIWD